MRWRKLGRVFQPDPSLPWASWQCMLPSPFQLDPDVIRVYCGFTAQDIVSRIGWVDVDAREPTRVIGHSREPVLDLGSRGSFDEDGVAPSCVVRVGGAVLLYYIGYQKHVRVRFTIFTGLSVSDDGGRSFRRIGTTPILDRTDEDLFFRSTPFVEKTADRWRLWYSGGGRWADSAGKAVATSDVRVIESNDPREWRGSARTVIERDQRGDVHALVRPWLFSNSAGDRLMLVSERSVTGARIASRVKRGERWVPSDEGALTPGPDPWEEGSVYYGSTLVTRSGTLLFYVGANFGQGGFGVARLEESGAVI